jgi:hypothetical protein
MIIYSWIVCIYLIQILVRGGQGPPRAVEPMMMVLVYEYEQDKEFPPFIQSGTKRTHVFKMGSILKKHASFLRHSLHSVSYPDLRVHTARTSYLATELWDSGGVSWTGTERKVELLLCVFCCEVKAVKLKAGARLSLADARSGWRPNGLAVSGPSLTLFKHSAQNRNTVI